MYAYVGRLENGTQGVGLMQARRFVLKSGGREHPTNPAQLLTYPQNTTQTSQHPNPNPTLGSHPQPPTNQPRVPDPYPDPDPYP